MKKKVLIIGPFSLVGGREIETKLIFESLKDGYYVEIISTKNFVHKKTFELLETDKELKTIDYLIFNKNKLIKMIVNLLCFFKPIKAPNYTRVKNRLTNFLFDYQKLFIIALQDKVKKFDCIMVCADIETVYNKEIIAVSSRLNIPVVFRITGKVEEINNKDLDWIKKVKLFIFHSKDNSKKIYSHNKNIIIIDQTTILEESLLKLHLGIARVKKFVILSRLSKEKNISQVIEVFVKVAERDDELHIYGEGKEKDSLINLSSDNRIFFHGYVEPSGIEKAIRRSHCLIISSKKESGPINAVEAMAAGLPIISTKVGAMEERLEGYKFFYDGQSSSLEKLISKIKTLNKDEINEVSEFLKLKYNENHALEVIKTKYKNTISLALGL